ncbi:hypothetical protein FQN50_003843 [Emmonsiellopsis sp. PD_5]|nr:hypothetical protein FQN50_003843 [Emmonsiellopsis sp. PD_5]
MRLSQAGPAAFLVLLRLVAGDSGNGSGSGCGAASSVPDYFQTEPGPFAGPTKTGADPFLAQTDAVGYDLPSYVPNRPLHTTVPVLGQSREDSSIFRRMGNLSPYFPCPSGFGVEEYPLPEGTNISQVHLLHRHGSRYPTVNSGTRAWAEKILANADQFTGNLSFLRDWSYLLGDELLTANGHLELFESGVLHYFNYGRLYDATKRLVARTTSQVRMLESAEYFLAGFFGLKWADKVDLEVIIEHDLFNNSLAGTKNCPNGNNRTLLPGYAARDIWRGVYLKNATEQLRKWSGTYNWTTEDTHYAQTMCTYETVSLGSSPFCTLFTRDEWMGFEYEVDLTYSGTNGFASPTGRAVGIGYVAEFIARVENHPVGIRPGLSQVNMTLDTSPSTFPTNQSLYLDFSHDTTIVSILTAFGLRQFAQQLSPTSLKADRELRISHIVPFAGRLAIEIITAPAPVAEKRRSRDSEAVYDAALPQNETRYVHFVLNQRTLPLGRSFEQCGQRDDGWCELGTFLEIQKEGIKRAQYERSCFGEYAAPGYGDVRDGVPLSADGKWKGDGEQEEEGVQGVQDSNGQIPMNL